jgi:hypothetical protein
VAVGSRTPARSARTPVERPRPTGSPPWTFGLRRAEFYPLPLLLPTPLVSFNTGLAEQLPTKAVLNGSGLSDISGQAFGAEVVLRN